MNKNVVVVEKGDMAGLMYYVREGELFSTAEKGPPTHPAGPSSSRPSLYICERAQFF